MGYGDDVRLFVDGQRSLGLAREGVADDAGEARVGGVLVCDSRSLVWRALGVLDQQLDLEAFDLRPRFDGQGGTSGHVDTERRVVTCGGADVGDLDRLALADRDAAPLVGALIVGSTTRRHDQRRSQQDRQQQ